MRRSLTLSFLALMAFWAVAQKSTPPKRATPLKVTVEQLEQSLSSAHDKSDSELAQALSGLELTERLSSPRLAHLKEGLPGEKSKEELLILADQSEFLSPPKDEIVADGVPDAGQTRAMLVAIVNYVNTTLRQFPNLMATRETAGFEDRPEEDVLQPLGMVGLDYLPLHLVGKSSFAVTYRDRKEVKDEKASKGMKQQGAPITGLVTSGEFGPILNTVVADALKGAIAWGRWEGGATGRVAVFHFSIPEAKSSYYVKFCCYMDGFRGDGQPDMEIFNQRAGYHGDITFNPSDGSILRVSLQAEMPPTGIVPNAGIVIEYSPVEIGGKTYICPSRSVSILQAHAGQQQGMYSKANYQGPVKTFLNDVEFKQYRRFGSETRILSSDAAPSPE